MAASRGVGRTNGGMHHAVKRAKLDPPISFHGLRHTYASLALMNGVPMQVVSENLGQPTLAWLKSITGTLRQATSATPSVPVQHALDW